MKVTEWRWLDELDWTGDGTRVTEWRWLDELDWAGDGTGVTERWLNGGDWTEVTERVWRQGAWLNERDWANVTKGNATWCRFHFLLTRIRKLKQTRLRCETMYVQWKWTQTYYVLTFLSLLQFVKIKGKCADTHSDILVWRWTLTNRYISKLLHFYITHTHKRINWYTKTRTLQKTNTRGRLN